MSVTNILNAWVNCLAINGIEHIYISPGSRNAPLIRAFLQNSKVSSFTAIDERSAGFMALGAAMTLKKPVALLCTSGTALLNYYPALTEAFYTGIPLLAISADRPDDLIDQWEGQCIRQKDVFFNHLGPTLSIDPQIHTINQIEMATGELLEKLYVNKPVHVNIPLHEPLYAPFTTLEHVEINGSRLHQVQMPVLPDELLTDIHNSEKIILLNGHSTDAYEFNNGGGLVLNDIVSNKWMKSNPRYWDALFLGLDEDTKKSLEPDLLITTGTSIVSKPFRNWLRTIQNVKQWHIGTQNPVGNPFFKDISIWFEEEVEAFQMIVPLLESKSSDYKELWMKLDRQIDKQLIRFLHAPDSFNEPTALQYVYQHFKTNCVIHLANSSAVRYASWLGWSAEKGPIFGNRGTSGIDGCSSTAVGYAQHSKDQVVLITGDVAFFYDINAFWGNGSIPPNLKIVVLNNGGGGIFNLIKGPELFEQSLAFQTTHHKRKAKSICQELGIEHFSASDYTELAHNIPIFLNYNGPSLLEINTNQADNVAWVQKIKNF